MPTTPQISFSSLITRLQPQRLPKSLPEPWRMLRLRPLTRFHPLPAPEHGAETRSLPNLGATRGPSRARLQQWIANRAETNSLKIPAAQPDSSNSSGATPQTSNPPETSPGPSPSGSTAAGVSLPIGPAGAVAGPVGDPRHDGDGICHGAGKWLCTVGYGHVCGPDLGGEG